MATPNLSLQTAPNGSSNVSAAYNDSMQKIDAVLPLVVQTMALTAPPATVLADIGATGAWAGQAGKIALCTAADVWAFIAAPPRTSAYNEADGLYYRLDGGVWTALSTGSGTARHFTENFLRGIAASASGGTSWSTGEYRPVSYNSGAGAGTTQDAPGALMSTGSVLNGLVNLFITSGLVFKLGREAQRYGCRFSLPVLSDGTHSFIFTFGLRTVISGVETDKILVDYTHSANGGNFVLKSTAASVTTTSNASVGPAADTEVEVELVFNAAGTSVTLYVNGVATTATLSTGLPAASVTYALGAMLYKTLGTTARTARVVRMWRG
jgi:hypothetical protein